MFLSHQKLLKQQNAAIHVVVLTSPLAQARNNRLRCYFSAVFLLWMFRGEPYSRADHKLAVLAAVTTRGTRRPIPGGRHSS